MRSDSYTKVVLTVIALALVSLAVNQATPSARAFGDDNCGLSYSPGAPCQFRTTPRRPHFSNPGIYLWTGDK
jgi:hypothetical protein